MDLEDQDVYIFDNYNRYNSEIDYTIVKTCFDILNWMAGKAEFDNVVYAAGIEYEGESFQVDIEELVDELFKDRRIKHKKKTLRKSLEFLLKDMYVKNDGVKKDERLGQK